MVEEGPLTITEIAEYIGHSQPSATKTIKEMIKAGLCENLKTEDKRRNLVGLTNKGRSLSIQLQHQYADIDAAVENMINEANYNLWEAVKEWEYLLEKELCCKEFWIKKPEKLKMYRLFLMKRSTKQFSER